MSSSDRVSTDREGHEHALRVRRALGGHVGVLSVFVGDRQIFVGTDGLPEHLQGVREIPALEGFCKHVKDTGCQLIVDDLDFASDVL